MSTEPVPKKPACPHGTVSPELEALAPKYRDHDGYFMPMGFEPDHYRTGLTYSPDDDDVFVVTYPKCGTTWMQYVLYLLRRGGEPMPPGNNLGLEVPFLEEMGAKYVTEKPKPRIVKSHFPYDLCPRNRKTKYIYVARNPKDCLTSFYHHTRNFAAHYDFLEGSFDVFFECFLAGRVDFNSYFHNLLSWYEHRSDPNVLFLTYEEMKEDLRDVVRRIGRFLGGDWQAQSQDENVVNKVVENSSHSSMKSDPSKWTFARNDEFIRKGIIGDWTEHFSPEQSKRLDREFRRFCCGSDCLKLWEKYGIPSEEED